jgi:hypothetical protein
VQDIIEDLEAVAEVGSVVWVCGVWFVVCDV